MAILQVTNMWLHAGGKQWQVKKLVRCCTHGLFAPIFRPGLSPQQPAESRLQQLAHTPRYPRTVLARNPQKRLTSNSTSPNFLNRRRCLAPSAVAWKQRAHNHDLTQDMPQNLGWTAHTERVTIVHGNNLLTSQSAQALMFAAWPSSKSKCKFKVSTPVAAHILKQA